MADLISQANRLNDVEINNNAPVSSQTMRRVGSDINYLLDYLGIDNGDTIGGPVTGLNVFSPIQTLTFSRTFTAADIGIDQRPRYRANRITNRTLRFTRERIASNRFVNLFI